MTDAERAELTWYRQAGAAWLAVAEHYEECGVCGVDRLCGEYWRLDALLSPPMLAALEARGEG